MPAGNVCLGRDHIFVIAHDALFCYYESALHVLRDAPVLNQLISSDGSLIGLTPSGDVLFAPFSGERLLNNQLTFKVVHSGATWIAAAYGDVFTGGKQGVHHFRINQYSTVPLQCPNRIKQAVPGLALNWFLSEEGNLLYSSKSQPWRVRAHPSSVRFRELAASHYQVGLSELVNCLLIQGQLYIWGESIHGVYSAPTLFGEISSKLKDVRLGTHGGFVLTQKGELWAWGTNGFGELGTSDYEPRLSPYPIIFFTKTIVSHILLAQGLTLCIATDKAPLHTVKPISAAGKVKKPSKEQKTHTRNRSKSLKISLPSQLPSARIPSSQDMEKVQLKRQNQLLRQKVRDLELDNGQMKNMLVEKEDTIYDITRKIHLLEEAIEEYERAISLRSIEQPVEESPRLTFRTEEERVLRPRNVNLVDDIIERIQESKEGISKSARKLRELLADE